MNIKVKLWIGIVFACMATAFSCYDASKIPPCTGGEQWPDPCAAAPRDAGRE